MRSMLSERIITTTALQKESPDIMRFDELRSVVGKAKDALTWLKEAHARAQTHTHTHTQKKQCKRFSAKGGAFKVVFL